MWYTGIAVKDSTFLNLLISLKRKHRSNLYFNSTGKVIAGKTSRQTSHLWFDDKTYEADVSTDQSASEAHANQQQRKIQTVFLKIYLDRRHYYGLEKGN